MYPFPGLNYREGALYTDIGGVQSLWSKHLTRRYVVVKAVSLLNEPEDADVPDPQIRTAHEMFEDSGMLM